MHEKVQHELGDGFGHIIVVPNSDSSGCLVKEWWKVWQEACLLTPAFAVAFEGEGRFSRTGERMRTSFLRRLTGGWFVAILNPE